MVINRVLPEGAPAAEALLGDEIVLAVRAAPDSLDRQALIQRFKERGAGAVVFRGPSIVMESLPPERPAVLLASELVSWDELYVLFSTLVSDGGRLDGGLDFGLGLGDLFGLADAIAAAADASVTIEDSKSRLLAYSSLADTPVDDPRHRTIVERGAPPEFIARLNSLGVLHALRTTSTVVRVPEQPDIGLDSRLAVGVRAGGEYLGSIWLAGADMTRVGQAEVVLTDASAVAALHLVQRRAADAVSRRARSAAVRTLLDGDPAAAGLDLAWMRSRQAAVLVVSTMPPIQSTNDIQARLLGVVDLQARAIEHDALSGVLGSDVVVVLPAPRRRERDGLRAAAEQIRQRIHASLGLKVRVGIGLAADDVQALPVARDTAIEAASIAVETGGVVDFEDVRARLVLDEILNHVEARRATLSRRVEELAAHDALHHTVYIASLLALLDAGHRIGQAAARLGVHPNTLRSRVQRALSIAAVDLDDPDAALLLHLHLRALVRDRGTDE
jgi:DNA-binding PucR family transcriptional regulator